MKINKQIIFIVITVLVAVLSVLFGIKPNLETRSQLIQQKDELTAKYNDLSQKEQNRPMYEAGITESEKKYQEVLSKFPEDIAQDKYIMFLENAEKNKDLKDVYFNSINMSEKEAFYTLGANTATTQTTVVAEEDGTTSQAASTTQATTTTQSTANATAAATTSQGTDVGYVAKLDIDYEGPYASIKNLLAYVSSYNERMNISSMDLTYDEEDKKLTGKMTYNVYAIAGPGRVLPETTIDGVDLKPDDKNIFDNGDNSNTKISKDLGLDDGSEILKNYDHFVMLNPIGADNSAVIIGANNDTAKQSYISSDENKVQDITIHYFKKDEKYYVNYSIGDTKYPEKNYEAGTEFTPSSSQIGLAVLSSKRKNDKDLGGVRASIINDTDLSVYIKVDSDDADNARFRIASRSGKVIVK